MNLRHQNCYGTNFYEEKTEHDEETECRRIWKRGVRKPLQ